MACRVSVVTPSFNQGRFIQRTIQSVLSQDMPGLEYIVVDGGSTDGTLEILRAYQDRLTWLSEKDEGQADAVNKGIRLASGDVIGWLNSDDIYYPGALAAVVEFLEAHPEFGVVYGEAYHIDENDNVIAPYPTRDWDFHLLTQTCYICQPATFFRRCLWVQWGGLDASLHYAMDYEYWLRLAQRGVRFGRLRRVVAGSRLHSGAKTLAHRVAVHSEINRMLRARLGRVPDRWLFNYAHAWLDARGLDRRSRWYPLLVSGLSVWAAVRWNKRISRDMWLTVDRWARAAVRNTYSASESPCG